MYLLYAVVTVDLFSSGRIHESIFLLILCILVEVLRFQNFKYIVRGSDLNIKGNFLIGLSLICLSICLFLGIEFGIIFKNVDSMVVERKFLFSTPLSLLVIYLVMVTLKGEKI